MALNKTVLKLLFWDSFFYAERRGKPSPRSSHESLQKWLCKQCHFFRFVVSSATPSTGGSAPRNAPFYWPSKAFLTVSTVRK